jgi:hypothetical protein
MPQRIVDLSASDPSSRGALELRATVALVEQNEGKGILRGKRPQLAGRNLSVEQVPALDRALEPGVCAPLRRMAICRWGYGCGSRVESRGSERQRMRTRRDATFTPPTYHANVVTEERFRVVRLSVSSAAEFQL